MAWTVGEFEYELQRDPQRRVLFVEGLRDLAFWKILVPIMERANTVIYPISEILIDIENGGERGRLFAFARLIQGGPLQARVRFFADADYDRILNIECPENVVLTDWRDLEAYALST